MKCELKKMIYINLDRRPDRRENMIKQLGNQHTIERISAIDGFLQRDYIVSQRDMFSNPCFIKAIDYYIADPTCTSPPPSYQCYDTNIHFGVMGNAMSHYQAWQKVLELENDTDCAVILQDDAMLVPNFYQVLNEILENIPDDAKIVSLGRHECAIGSHFVAVDFNDEPKIDELFQQRVSSTIGKLKPHTNPCSLAYVMTKAGAEFIINKTKSFHHAMDWHLNHMLMDLDIHYATYKALATSDTRNFRSDIFDADPPTITEK